MPYLEHFGFIDWPFRLSPHQDLFFPEQHQPVLDSAEFAVLRGEPVVKITGEVGTGKTLLCRLLISRLRNKGGNVAVLGLPRAGYHATIRGVSREFGIDKPTDEDLFDDLSTVLSREHEGGRRCVLVVDEAQALGRKGLETIRLLSNLETDRAKLLQIVLIGQPELDRLTSEYGMRQIRQRITFSFTTEPFSCAAGIRYIRHRIQKLSHVPANNIFTRRAMKILVKTAHGTPRTINIAADRALLTAYAADARVVRGHHVRRAVRDAGLIPSAGRFLRRTRPAW